MKLAELMVDDWVALSLEASTLEEALAAILRRVARTGHLSEDRARELAAALARGDGGELHAVNDRVVAVMASVEALEGPALALGVGRGAFALPAGRRGSDDLPETVRAAVVILTPSSLTRVRKELLPELVRVLRDPGRTERLLAATSPTEVRAIRELMDTEFRVRKLVEDALLPVQYRVYPDTPLSEVLDLMVRRQIRAVPVVGEQYEVLGILTSGDALDHLLHGGGGEDDEQPTPSGTPTLARDVMTRTVLCVSEDQSLRDAANMMVNRDVEQLPVVRDGELVGFVTRDSILGTLHGARARRTESDEPDTPSTP